MKEILIISNYYPPEKGAAANRIEQLAQKLHENKYKVSVLCPLGNYPMGKLFPEYKNKFSVTENRDNITIKRLWIYPSISKNLLIRIFSVASFSSSLLLYLLFKKTPQKVVIQSPPLLLSFISVVVLSLKKKKIILNVSDLWPLAAIELQVLKKNSFSHQFSLFLERFIYKKATLVLGQSNEIINHIQTFFPNKKCYLYQNLPDHKINHLTLKTVQNEPIKIFYAGLLGIAQGVSELCQKIEIKNLNIELHIFGDGAEKNEIEHFITHQKIKKIYFQGMINRNDLLKALETFDIAIVPLKNRIYGSVPSKIFEYSAMGFPVLYFGGGEGETIVTENKLGWVAKVGDFNDLNKKIVEISNLSKTELERMKERIFTETKSIFNLHNQINYLIDNAVF
jgi:glycosyltransferase involved in cell wall biosynthesis